MANICTFYRSPKGCSRGSRCGFFHLNKEKKRIVEDSKKKNIHAFKHVCVAALFDNCSNSSCMYLHPRDDVRYKDQKEEIRKLNRDNQFLARDHTEMETLLKSMEKKNRSIQKELDSANIYIDTVRKDRTALCKDIAKKNSDIERLEKENQELNRMISKSSNSNRYLLRKNTSLMKDIAMLRNRECNKVITHDEKTETIDESEKKEEDIRIRKQFFDMLQRNNDFIPLVHPSEEACSDNDIVNPPPRKKMRYFDTVVVPIKK